MRVVAAYHFIGSSTRFSLSLFLRARGEITFLRSTGPLSRSPDQNCRYPIRDDVRPASASLRTGFGARKRGCTKTLCPHVWILSGTHKSPRRFRPLGSSRAKSLFLSTSHLCLDFLFRTRKAVRVDRVGVFLIRLIQLGKLRFPRARK